MPQNNIPGNPTDAGPLSAMLPGHTEQCSTCRLFYKPESVSRCQGASPDDCTNLICDDCLVKCECCHLPVCTDHQRKMASNTVVCSAFGGVACQ